jgi:hypothetical protein
MSEKKIVISINTEYDCATLKYPEYKRMPSECAKIVRDHIFEHNSTNPTIFICTCSEVPIHVIGELIFNKKLSNKDVSIMYDGKTYLYDAEGYLNSPWPYGVFGIHFLD